ncbi:DNA-directed RNA polymerase omega subunit [hydrothermal vent metagenome]|uniref:DNA-directed RNA polymerase n=1 Tax=hydrothermal vent metagenome TaxID=652676 RepID=A0A1W1EKR2_9ZZZZ
MRTEQLTARALEKVGEDKYLLASAVGKRVTELVSGSAPLVQVDSKKYKFADIALYEIAEGKIEVSLES